MRLGGCCGRGHVRVDDDAAAGVTHRSPFLEQYRRAVVAVRAAIPPNTLEVIRQRDGACWTAVPNGQRSLTSTIRFVVASSARKPPSMACLRRT
jgi:hypothetical protein